MASSVERRLVAIIVLAVGFYVLGQLAHLTAMPPSYAAPVWPAAGLALVGLLHFGSGAWPGIMLGSLAISLLALGPVANPLLPSPGMASAMAVAATVQALVAALLVRRVGTGERSLLTLALGGPVASVISPTVGVAMLSASSSYASADIWFNWFTWWIGDAIGALIVLTLYLIWTHAPGFIARRSRVLATLSMLVLLAVVTLLFVRTSTLERETVKDEFTRKSEAIVHNIEQKVAEYTEALYAVSEFLTETDVKLDRERFHRLVANMLRRHPNLHAISWSPRVLAGQRSAYEQAMRDDGVAPRGMLALDPNGHLVPAGQKSEYAPVTFMEPVRNNTGALGFDLTSEPVRYAAMARARDSGRAATSARVGLVHVTADRSGVLIVAPTYHAGQPHASVEQRRSALRGYVSAVLRVESMVNDFLLGTDLAGIHIRVSDLGPQASATVLAQLPRSAPASAGSTLGDVAVHADLLHRATLMVADRPWEFAFTLDRSSPLQAPSPISWSSRAVGLLFSGLFSAFVLVSVRRTATVERKVAERTQELRESNTALQASSAALGRSEQALRASDEQARSVLETARDAYVAIDANGRIVAWNREAELTLGWPREQAIGRRLVQLLLPTRSGRVRSSRIVQHLVSGRARFLNRRLETSVQHRDGSTLPVELIIWSTVNGNVPTFHAFLHDITQRRQALQRLAAQEMAAAALVESTALSDAAPKVLHAICASLGWSVGTVWMVDAGHDHLACSAFWSAERDMAAFETQSCQRRINFGEGLPGGVWRSRQPAWVSDIAVDARFTYSIEALDAGLHAAFAFPISAGGELLGVLECFSRNIAAPDEGLLTMMDTVGNLLGQFVARRRAETALFEEKELAQVTLGSIGDGVIVTDLASRITYLNPVAEALTGWSAAQARGMLADAVFRLVAQPDGAPLTCPLTAAIQGNRRVGLSVETELVRRDGNHISIEDSAAPVHDRAGQVVGGVIVFHDVSDTRAMQRKLSHLTRHDHLTSLPNRALLQERLVQAIATARARQDELALLYIDLDGFKHINDSLGHAVGDLLLQEVTQRLLDSVRSVDTLSRQGGDEFTLLLPDIRSSSDAVRMAENILRTVARPFHIGGVELNLTASVGIALYPDDSDDAGALLKNADAAMYRAKHDGRNQYRFFTREISQNADRRLAIESALHQALRNDEFVLHYQPKVDAASGAITGMEALVRWRRADGRLTMPGEFIEIAEDSGLIGRIDQWVLGEACRQNRAWQDAGLLAVPVAVNLSAASVQVEPFLAYLKSVLEHTGLSPACLQIELTESQMLHDTDRFEALIRAISAAGVKVAIDDFGTGYSSLGYLQRFPFDMLKIDQSFVRLLADGNTESAIVEAITRLAHALGFAVVAEGVETHAQARILQGYGCHEMQGYLYSRPVPPEQFEVLLRRGVVDATQLAGIELL